MTPSSSARCSLLVAVQGSEIELQTDPTRLVQYHDLRHAIEREALFPHLLGFRRMVGHKLQTDRPVMEYGLEFEHCGFVRFRKEQPARTLPDVTSKNDSRFPVPERTRSTS